MLSFCLNKGTNLAGADERAFTKSEAQMRDVCRLSYIGDTLLKLNFDTERRGFGAVSRSPKQNTTLKSDVKLNNLTTRTRWQRRIREDLQILRGMKTTHLCFHLFSYFGLRGLCTNISVCDEQTELDWF